MQKTLSENYSISSAFLPTKMFIAVIIILYIIGKTFDQKLKGNFNSSSIWMVWQQTTDTQKESHTCLTSGLNVRSHELNIKKVSIQTSKELLMDHQLLLWMDIPYVNVTKSRNISVCVDVVKH